MSSVFSKQAKYVNMLCNVIGQSANKCFDENCSYRMKTSLTFDGAVLMIAEAFW